MMKSKNTKMNFYQNEFKSNLLTLCFHTQTHVKFKKDPDSYMDEWFAEAPTHHFAMSIGHNASLFEKISDILDIPSVILDK